MPHRFAHRFASCRLPEPRSTIAARGDHPFSLRTEGCSCDAAIMPQRLAHRLARRRLPDRGPCGSALAVTIHSPCRTNAGAHDTAIMPQRFARRFSRRRLPHPRRAIVARRNHPNPVRTKGCTADTGIMPQRFAHYFHGRRIPHSRRTCRHLPLRPTSHRD